MRSVLIVEDECLIGLHLALLVENMGFQVIGPVGGGREAEALARLHRPDVVLMDISIAGDRDGIETAAAIAADIETQIVFITAEASFETRRRAACVKPAAYLGKPFLPGQVALAVETAFNA